MARTALVPVRPTTLGVASNLVAVDATASPNGMSFPWVLTSILHVKTAGTVITITIATNITFADGLVLPNRVIVTAATSETFIGPFPQAEYQQADGNVWVNFSVATACTAEVLQTTT